MKLSLDLSGASENARQLMIGFTSVKQGSEVQEGTAFLSDPSSLHGMLMIFS